MRCVGSVRIYAAASREDQLYALQEAKIIPKIIPKIIASRTMPR
jgi:hypothetical protein